MSLLLSLLLASPAASGVMVVPPEGPNSPEGAWIAQAVADGLPRALGLLGVPAVDRADRLRAQEALGIPALTLTRATSIRVAEGVGASRVVVGTCQLEGSEIRLALRVLDVERAILNPPINATGPLESLPALIRGLAFDIALSGPAPPSRSREEFLAQRPVVPFEAFRTYAQGLATSDPGLRRKRLQHALALFPGYDEARLALGRLQIETRDYTPASETLARVAASSPLARAARFLQGAALLHLERYAEAADLYGGLLAQQTSAAALSNQALARLRQGGVPHASALLRQAVEAEPDFPDLAFNLGWALLVEGDPQAAAFWLKGITQRDPRDAIAHLVLSWALRKGDKEAEAVEEWRLAAALDPSYEPLASPDLTRHLERILASERPLVLDNEGRSGAEMAATSAARGEKLAEAGDREGALSELTRAAYLDPYSARTHLLLARIHHDRGEAGKALGELRMALWCREDTAVRLELAGVLKELGRPAEARAEARKVLEAQPTNAAARRLLEAP